MSCDIPNPPRVACCNTVLLWVQLLKYLRALKFLGPLIAVYAGIIEDILRYFLLGMVFLVPYVICFWVMFGGPQSASLTGSAKKDLSTVLHVAVMTFRMTLVDSYPYDVSPYHAPLIHVLKVWLRLVVFK